VIEVFLLPADVHHAVDGAGTAENFAAWPEDAAAIDAGIGFGFVAPVDGGIGEGLAEARGM